MKRFLLFIQSALLLTGFQSCIQDEPLIAECDITGIDSTWYKQYAAATDDNPEGKDLWIGNANVQNDYVNFIVKTGTDRSAFAPKFTLTLGTRLTAEVDGQVVDANGIERDFTQPQVYTATSEDGKWSKNYLVSFNYPQPIDTLDFEHFKLSGKYYKWFEVDKNDNELDYWSSGNGGYNLVGIAKKPEDYPTYPFNDAERGASVRLSTRRTGSYGNKVHMPIAAGSLFIGTFDTKIAMKRPREATAFGLQVLKPNARPKSLEGWYKYTAGDMMTDINKKEHPELRDTADIYAVVYEVDPNHFEALNGDDVLTSERIVMMARIDNPGEPAQWKPFNEPFKLKPGKNFDQERLNSYGYAIAVVATSSRQGAYFEGAADDPQKGYKGSVLDISHLRVVYE